MKMLRLCIHATDVYATIVSKYATGASWTRAFKKRCDINTSWLTAVNQTSFLAYRDGYGASRAMTFEGRNPAGQKPPHQRGTVRRALKSRSWPTAMSPSHVAVNTTSNIVATAMIVTAAPTSATSSSV